MLQNQLLRLCISLSASMTVLKCTTGIRNTVLCTPASFSGSSAMHTVAGESILRDFRVLVDSHGAPNAEIELELEESRLPQLLAALRSPGQASWERGLEPLVDSTRSPPRWHFMSLAAHPPPPPHPPLSHETPSYLPDPESSTPPPPRLIVPAPEDLEMVMRRERDMQGSGYPGRKRSSVPEDLRVQMTASLPKQTADECLLEEEDWAKTAMAKVDAAAAGADDSAPEDEVWVEARRNLKPGQKLAMDWKGDPMVLNAGDNLPGIKLM